MKTEEKINRSDICLKFNKTPNGIKYCCGRIGIINNKHFSKSEAEIICKELKKSIYFRGDKHIRIIEKYLERWSPSLIGIETKTSKYTVMKAIEEYHENDNLVIVESKLNFMF